jgi:hypothetical protein
MTEFDHSAISMEKSVALHGQLAVSEVVGCDLSV